MATASALLLGLVATAWAYEAGDLDRGFSGDGTMQFRMSGADSPTGVAVRKGETVVSGRAGSAEGGLWTAARITDEGRLDRSFSRDGKQSFRVPVGEQQPVNGGAEDVAIQPDGKPVLVGYTITEQGGQRLAIARLTKQGQLDKSFSGDGRNGISLQRTSASRVAIQDNGRIVVVGSADFTEEILVVRFMPDGTLDQSFGSAGVVRADHLNGDHATERGFDVAIQDDGKIVVAGESATAQDSFSQDAAVMRLNRDGSADESFSRDGFVAVGAGGYDSGTAVGLQSDGTIIVAGYTSYQGANDGNGNNDEFVAALTPEGARDGSFGTGPGITYIGYAGDEYVQDIAISNGDDIVVAGGRQDPDTPIVTRIEADGDIDYSFGAGGAALDGSVISAIALERGFLVMPYDARVDGEWVTRVSRLHPRRGRD